MKTPNSSDIRYTMVTNAIWINGKKVLPADFNINMLIPKKTVLWCLDAKFLYLGDIIEGGGGQRITYTLKRDHSDMESYDLADFWVYYYFLRDDGEICTIVEQHKATNDPNKTIKVFIDTIGLKKYYKLIPISVLKDSSVDSIVPYSIRGGAKIPKYTPKNQARFEEYEKEEAKRSEFEDYSRRMSIKASIESHRQNCKRWISKYMSNKYKIPDSVKSFAERATLNDIKKISKNMKSLDVTRIDKNIKIKQLYGLNKDNEPKTELESSWKELRNPIGWYVDFTGDPYLVDTKVYVTRARWVAYFNNDGLPLDDKLKVMNYPKWYEYYSSVIMD